MRHQVNFFGKFSWILMPSLAMLLVVLAQSLASCQDQSPAGAKAVAAVAEPPAPATAPADGLVAHFDAAQVVKDGDSVTQWTDLSGQKNTVSMDDAARRPVQVSEEVAGLPVVRFDGAKQQVLTLPALKTTPKARGLTIAVVARVKKATGNDAFATLGTYYTGNPDYLMMHVEQNTARLMASSRGGGAASSGGSMSGGFNVAIVDFDLGKGITRLFQNGVSLRGGPCAKGVDLKQNFAVGSYCGVHSFLTGDIAEMLVYDRVLTEAQMSDVNAYLTHKYKLDFSRYVTPLATTLPFAYFPSSNQLEAAVDLTAFGAKPDGAKKDVTVEILPVGGKEPVATGKVLVDQTGRGQDIFSIPDLKDGKYNVSFTYNGVTRTSDRVITRTHFDFEKCDLGTEHKIYTPFEPVTVNDDRINVVSRTLRTNGFGLFDSIVAAGEEVLAEPIRLEGMAGGKKIKWTFAKPTVKSEFVDLATVKAQAKADAVTVNTVTKIEEDGCARVEMELSPGAKSATIDSLWVEIPLKDEQVPLFHWAITNELRNNYGGVLPKGGKVVWDVKSQVGTIPTYKVEAGPSDGVVWDSTQFKTWPNSPQGIYFPTFMPYIWLGSEARGLAWFGDNAKGYELDNASAVQVIHREGKKVVLRVHLVQAPLTLRTPRKIVFGLQASPTKPLRADWRTQEVPSGWECVTPWGGYYCSSKYPDGHDFKIVDKIVEAGLTGKVDTKYFQEKDKNRVEKDPARPDQPAKVQGSQSWLETQLRFAGNAANSYICSGGHAPSLASYFEEHFTMYTYPEFEVFKDEWSEQDFPRFRDPMAGWATYPHSYRNFTAYYGNEYVRRGCGLYFDNCCPKPTYNYRTMPAFTTADGGVHPATSLWDTRAYYKRMYKIIQAQNEKKTFPYPLNFYLHMTNTQVLPYTTWSTFLLDQEQVYRSDEKTKQMLPWPPDYLRAVTLARSAGSIPTSLNPLRSGLGNSEFWAKPSPEQCMSNWGMHKVHEIYGQGFTPWFLATNCERSWNEFGYREPDMTIYNYWDPKSPIKVDNDKVKYVAQTRNGRGIIVLQSYSLKETQASVRWPGAVSMMDFQDRKALPVNRNGYCQVTMPANYGTRMLMVWTDPATLPQAVDAKTLFMEDFEFGVRPEVKQLHPCFNVVSDTAKKGNFVLRMMPDNNSQQFTPAEGKAPAAGPSELSFRVRVPVLPKDRNRNGLLMLTYGADPKAISFQFVVDLDTQDGETTWVITPPVINQNGKPAPLVAGKTNLTSGANAQGPRRKELGKADTEWHRIAVRVEGKQHTILLDDKVVYEGTAPAEAVGGNFAIGSSWDQAPGKERMPYVEIDDVKVTSLAK